MKRAAGWLDRLFDETDDPAEPGFDPVDLGTAVLVTLTAFGVLYWLLWTLLVFEGGFFELVGPALSVAFTSKRLQDYGYEGPWDLGVFEGWLGNSVAFVLTLVLAAGLADLYRRAKKAHRK